MLHLRRRAALLRHAEQNVAGGEHFTVVVARLTIGCRRDGETLLYNFEEFARAGVGDRCPECGVEFLGVVERVTVGTGLGDQLVIHPEIGDNANHILAERDFRRAKQLRELLDRQFFSTGLRNGIRVRTECTAVAADQLGHGANGNRGEGKSSHSSKRGDR